LCKKILIVLVLCISIVLTGNTSYATRENTISRSEKTPSKDESQKIQLQLKKEINKAEKEKDKKRKLALKNLKNKYSIMVKEDLFKKDKKKYKKILKVLFKLLKPLNDHTCKGGQTRVTSLADVLNTLLTIHFNKAYCSQIKRNHLDKLLIKAKNNLTVLDNSPKMPFKLKLPSDGNYRDETKEFFSKLANGKDIKLVGANICGAYVYGSQLGVSAGTSKTPYGDRRTTIAGRTGGFLGLGGLVTIGYNSLSHKHGKTFGNYGCGGKAGIVLGGGGSGLEKMSGVEGGAGLGFMGGADLIGGVELFPLPVDWKHFRKNIGLVPETGKLPTAINKQIRKAKNKKDLMEIKHNEFLTILSPNAKIDPINF
jgi:hypothetical protein